MQAPGEPEEFRLLHYMVGGGAPDVIQLFIQTDPGLLTSAPLMTKSKKVRK